MPETCLRNLRAQSYNATLIGRAISAASTASFSASWQAQSQPISISDALSQNNVLQKEFEISAASEVSHALAKTEPETFKKS